MQSLTGLGTLIEFRVAGPSGVGKTSIAVAVAEAMEPAG
jgi:ATP-dependent Clp protease ATP-binding subunit ClpA